MQHNKGKMNLTSSVDAFARPAMAGIQLIELVSDATFAIDCQKRIIAWNKAMESLTRVKAADILGKSDYEYALPFYKERRPLLIDYVLNPQEDIDSGYHRITRQGDILIAEVKYSLSNGKKILVEVHAKPLYDSEGEVIGAIETIKDVTEYKLVNRMLGEIEARYSALFDRSLECVYIHDFEGNFIDANKTLQDVLGYTMDELLRIGLVSMIDTDQHPLARRTRDEIINNGYQHGTSVYRLKRKDGQIVCLETKGVLIYKDEEPYAIQGVARDITERMKTEEALRQSEQKYRNIFDNVYDFLFVHDMDGNLIETNLATKMETGYTAEDVFGMKIIDLMPDQYKHFFAIYMEELRKKGRMEGLISILTKEGRERVIEYKNMLVSNESGAPFYVQGSGRDITERIRAEKALMVSEEKYRNILEGIEEPYFEVDLAGRFTFFNPALSVNLGYSEEELLGMSYTKYMDRDNAKKVFAVFHNVFVTGEPTRAFEWELVSKMGRKIYAEASISLLRDSKGTPAGFRGLVRDVTERKEAEKERNRYEMRLAQAQKMEAIGTLAGGIAHDFNNMLSAIIGYTELVKNEVKETSRARVNLDHVLKAGMRARDLVAQILSFGRKLEAERSSVQVSMILKEALKLLKVTIPSTIQIRDAIQCEDASVFADPTEIHQIIMNLCTNAYQAMEETGGVLSVSLESVELGNEDGNDVRGRDLSTGSCIVLKVGDTGCGMDDETIKHIFDPFFTTKERGKGTGLGLATVHRIVTDLKGRIFVESAVGKGTSFTIHLPRIVEEQKETPGS